MFRGRLIVEQELVQMDKHEHFRQEPKPAAGGFWRSRAGLVLIVFTAVAGLLLVYEHRLHVFSSDALLSVLLVVFVISHIFMHRGHGGHEGHGGRDRNDGDMP